ncbi:S8/S53 family peptidase [Methylorubrum sp. SB2]|uniref:S8/S53 family peptidase n=1 Tax=Methylorubrum subtropicum TaxID=3138812 RepID=UPI00313E5A5A
MRVSCIVTLPAQAALRTSAAAAFTANPLGFAMDTKPDKAGLIIDPTFSPLPIPSAQAGGIALEAAGPQQAPVFVGRGTIDVDRIHEIAAEEDGVGIFADPEIGTFTVCSGNPPVGATADVARKLDTAQLLAKKLDGKGVALAIMDTGINLAHLKGRGLKPKLSRKYGWAPPGSAWTPGSYPVDHGTMCAYDALIAAPKATLLDFPILRSTTPGGSVMSGFLSDAILAYSYLLSRLQNPSWPFRALVVNNSWGMYHPSWDFPAGHPGRYADNPNHPFNLIVGTLARAGADILFAAGNCGADCPDGQCKGVVTDTITGANAHPDVLTLAGCDIDDQRVGYSSQGPGIAGMAPDKPDVTAYTHFLGSEAYGAGSPDSGTSTACPVAAGCVAALRTRLAPAKEPPASLFATIRAQALGKPGPGWNADYGTGIIRPVPVATVYGL